MSTLAKRMEKTRLTAGFNVSDLARWFGVPQSTAFTWCRGMRTPKPHSVPEIEKRLTWLDHECKKKRGKLPIPLALRQHERAAYVETLRASYEQRARRG